jgi:hypothetical protein
MNTLALLIICYLVLVDAGTWLAKVNNQLVSVNLATQQLFPFHLGPPSVWEQWQIVVTEPGVIALRAANGRYVTIGPDKLARASRTNLSMLVSSNLHSVNSE